MLLRALTGIGHGVLQSRIKIDKPSRSWSPGGPRRGGEQCVFVATGLFVALRSLLEVCVRSCLTRHLSSTVKRVRWSWYVRPAWLPLAPIACRTNLSGTRYHSHAKAHRRSYTGYRRRVAPELTGSRRPVPGLIRALPTASDRVHIYPQNDLCTSVY